MGAGLQPPKKGYSDVRAPSQFDTCDAQGEA
jgi:hypothetical protein